MSETKRFGGVPNLSHALATRVSEVGPASVWALLDPVVSDPFQRRLAGREVIRLPLRHPDLPEQKRPYLVRVGEPGRDVLMDDMLQIAHEEALRHPTSGGGPKVRSVCGYLAIETAPERAASDLARTGVLMWQGQRRLLRLWDPRTMDLFACLLDEQQISTLLTHIQAWWWLGRDGEIRTFSRPSVSPAPPSDDFKLGAQQVTYLQLSEAINGTLDVMQDLQIPLGDARYPERIGALVERGIRQWQLTSTADRVTYALHAVLYGSDFDTIQLVRDAMNLERQSSGVAVRALEKYSDENWERMMRQPSAKASDSANTRREDHG